MSYAQFHYCLVCSLLVYQCGFIISLNMWYSTFLFYSSTLFISTSFGSCYCKCLFVWWIHSEHWILYFFVSGWSYEDTWKSTHSLLWTPPSFVKNISFLPCDMWIRLDQSLSQATTNIYYKMHLCTKYMLISSPSQITEA
jgi:hypothetical protein